MNSIYFIAEVGKACNGQLDYCKKLLAHCKEAGVNAVRFHHFFLDANVHPDALQANQERAWSFKLKWPFLSENLFSPAEYGVILHYCRELGLDFVASPWDLKSLKLFQELEVTHYKINSINAMNIPLVQAVVATGSKTFISTGGMLESEVAMLVQMLELDSKSCCLLHAVLAYPAPINNINLRAIEIMKKYHPEVGYSSNDLAKTSVIAACMLGATCIERHVHLDTPPHELHKASIPISQYAEEIGCVLEMQEVTARKSKGQTRGEMINQEILCKSFVLGHDLPANSLIKEQDLLLQMPAKGIPSKQWFAIIGKKTGCDLKKGQYLYSKHIEGTNSELARDHSLNLETAVGPSQKAQDFESESLVMGAEHSQTAKAAPITSDYGSKDCAFWPDPTAVSRLNHTPGKKGVVVRFKDIDEMIEGRQIDYVEVHYAAADLKKPDLCKDYDLDLVVHVPEYAEGRLLDLTTHDEAHRKFSIQIINSVMQRARNLKPLFRKCKDLVPFILHPGSHTYPGHDTHPEELYDIFVDSWRQLDTYGLEVLIENMAPCAWFLTDDWSPKQALSNRFMDAQDLARFCREEQCGMCLDVCHAKLYCTYARKDYRTYLNIVQPCVKHLHFSDCAGVDCEGLQLGEGEIDWQEICEVFQNFRHGWTPEIWNGHLDQGEKFYEAHQRLNQEFKIQKFKKPCMP